MSPKLSDFERELHAREQPRAPTPTAKHGASPRAQAPVNGQAKPAGSASPTSESLQGVAQLGKSMGLDPTQVDRAVARVEASRLVDLQGFTDTDIANAQRFAHRHGMDVRYTEATGWLSWDGARWCEDAKGLRVQARAKDTALSIFDEVKTTDRRDELFKHAKRSQSRQAIESMVTLARSEPGVLMRITDFDTNPMLLNVTNGTVDLGTGELQRHKREHYITRVTPIEYIPGAQCPLWERFLRRVLAEDQELIAYMRRMVGYLLTGKTTEQVLHFLHGGGKNGKTVFVETLLAVLGEYAVVARPEMVMKRRHSGIPNDIARLRGMRAVFMNETNQGESFDEAKLKDLTGSDTLSARFLHQEFFDFPPTHKLMIRGNYKPVVNGTDEAIWRRMRLVPFGVEIPEYERDPELPAKLRKELPGILAWAVQGCLEWQRDGLKPPALIVDAVRAYREESDTLGRFIADHCDTSSKLSQVKSGVFFKRYQQFAETGGERWLSNKELPYEMHRRGFEWKRTKESSVYLGIALRLDEREQWSDR